MSSGERVEKLRKGYSNFNVMLLMYMRQYPHTNYYTTLLTKRLMEFMNKCLDMIETENRLYGDK